jgi:hypothetical protein
MTRLEKYDIYNQFFAQAKEFFTEIDANYKPHFDLRKSYGLYIAPGSCMGGQEPTVVEVIYGNKSYRSATKIVRGHETYEAEIAYGSRLYYQQIDTGDILLILNPAYTEKHKAQEQFIIIDYIKNPKKLLNKKYISKHFRYMVSYLAVTSIENKPKLSDRIRIFYLRIAKSYNVENKNYEPRIKRFLAKAFIQILIVGFSGILLAFLPLFINLNRNKQLEKQVEAVIESKNKIIMLLDMINEKSEPKDYSLYLEEIKDELKKINENFKKNDEK